MNPAVVMDGVSVSFPRSRRVGGGAFKALSNLSLRLDHGDKLAVIGRNGAGKSTLLRVIADLIQPDSGKIVRSHGPCQLLALGVGFLDHLSGRENAILSGLFMGLRRREIQSKLDAIIEFSELGDFFDQPVRAYSSGMRSRLGFSVAMQQQPDILLIDETLSVGDLAFRQKSRQAIRSRLNSGMTVVLVSHEEHLISEVCSQVIWIEHGEMVAQGPTEKVLPDYMRAAKQGTAR